MIGQVPASLVELALWLADYYGTTPARALALVAPESPKRRKEQAPPAERQALGGEAEPLELSAPRQAAVARVVEAMDGGGGNLLLYGATGSGKTEVYLQACAAALERGLASWLTYHCDISHSRAPAFLVQFETGPTLDGDPGADMESAGGRVLR